MAVSTLITINVGGHELIDSKLVLVAGCKYALIGKNGVGKSTLLRHLSKTLKRVVLCEQEPVASKLSPLDIVVQSDEKLNMLTTEIEDPETTDDRLCELYEEMATLNSDSAKPRARQVLSGLGFTRDVMESSCDLLSGGFRIRVTLAKALFMKPPVLLLDEPSNHLDLNAIIWLEDYIKTLKSTVIVVSHNIALIDNICDTIIDLENGKLAYFRGNYSEYKNMIQQQLVQKKAQCKRGQKNSKKHDIKQRAPKHSLSFENFTDIPSGPLVTVTDVSFEYVKGNLTFQDVSFGLYKDSKITLVGPNGVGKTTFLKLLNKTIDPVVGTVTANRKITIATFNQHCVDVLDGKLTPTEYLVNEFKISVYDAREALGKFGLIGHQHLVKIKDLSGGQKARVAFAEIFCKRPDVLLLDEPTNNLDLESIDALILGLRSYNSAIVMISHDERLINELDCELYVVANLDVVKFNGSFLDYKTCVLKCPTF
jgi:ATP-binding cassette, subfamily F, member 1